ncbi:Aminomethyltransferase [Planctomycetes bacterium Poly30]|uniref:Aminomethyltransferase n=1 Tax=Saltatorellus ferox TaxID=2528018 RepID=A0A518EQ83_9BACT|nr:Aminomethyltransferase [Planctomycetes bacterium Poly30]
MQKSPLRAVHESAGARLRPEEAGGQVITYGDVPAEYAAGTQEGALLLDVTTRGLLTVMGKDARDFLHRILANDIKGLTSGQGNRNLLLTGKGKIVSMFDLCCLGQGFLLSTPPGQAGPLRDALDMYLFTEDVTLADETEAHAPIEIVGPGAAEIIESVLPDFDPTSDTPHTFQFVPFHLDDSDDSDAAAMTKVTPMLVAGRSGFRLETEPEHVAELWRVLQEFGATPGGLVAYDSLRAESVAGEFGRDITDDVYPQEARLEDAFSLTKGCYIGQEVVAKIDTYGGLNKRLFRLRVSHDDPVAPGTRILRSIDGESRDLGVVTTWAYSFEADGGVVLGYLKRKHQEPGTEFLLGETGATAVLQD